MERNANFNFSEMGIPIGSILFFSNNKNIKARVINDRKVEFENQETFLTPLTQKLLNINYAIDPTKYWYYKNKVILGYIKKSGT